MSGEIMEYASLVKGIKELIYRRQYEAMKRVNADLILLYWEIGEEITRPQNVNLPPLVAEISWTKNVLGGDL